ncbi:MAG: YdeI/OmpD-associated family protein [Crocinitomicaceae bacterium]|nr:YdeI/OmpD-associated family protein [Crocinitomicaceae bacterium]
MEKTVDAYLEKTTQWNDELIQLRRIVLTCNLIEVVKWGVPCYMHNNKNILLFHAFKEYCAIGFFKGSLLLDSENILSQPGANSQAGRQIRFSSLSEIIEKEAVIKAYIFEAIEVENAGLKVQMKTTNEYKKPIELETIFHENSALKKAFEALTPGRQRGYLLHFSSAKQADTRISRIEKCKSKILAGKGINDCTCGLSKRLPMCDGSHKFLKQ